MSIIRNIDVAENYIHTITEADLDGRNVPLGHMEVCPNVNRVRGEFQELSGTPPKLNEWFGVPLDRKHGDYIFVAAYGAPRHGDTNWSDHGAPEKAVATKVVQGGFRPELFPAYFPAIWLEGLTDGDIIVINKSLAFRLKFYTL